MFLGVGYFRAVYQDVVYESDLSHECRWIGMCLYITVCILFEPIADTIATRADFGFIRDGISVFGENSSKDTITLFIENHL